VDPRDGRARRELLGRWTPHVGENDADADDYSEQEKSARSQGGFRKVPRVPNVPTVPVVRVPKALGASGA